LCLTWSPGDQVGGCPTHGYEATREAAMAAFEELAKGMSANRNEDQGTNLSHPTSRRRKWRANLETT
jgi:hypothetical protein